MHGVSLVSLLARKVWGFTKVLHDGHLCKSQWKFDMNHLEMLQLWGFMNFK